MPDILEKLGHEMKEVLPKEPQNLQLCSSSIFYNFLQNEGDKILVLDMRSVNDFL